MSKMDIHNQFGFKFYKGGMIPKHQNASGEKLGVNIPYNKEEVDYLRNNFDIINWKNYHTKGMPLKGEYVSYITDGDPDPIRDPGHAFFTTNKPALFGIQLPEGYTKYTTRHDLNYNTIGLEEITYGKTPLENDTTILDNMYKVPTNYKEYIQKHQNASGEELKEKIPVLSQSTSALFYDENGNPVVQNVDMVSGESKDGKTRNFQKTITYRDGIPVDSSMYDFNRRIPIENPDSAAYYNELLKEMLMRSNPVGLKKGGSLKKCSCGCKTLLKRNKGGKVMESRNCK